MSTVLNEDELMHHGVLGMRWGIRRYQNKDGSLTEAGRKRVAKYENKIEKLKGKSKYKEDGSSKKSTASSSVREKKNVSEMTDEEINREINRMRLEEQYNSYFKQPEVQKQTSAGKKFVNRVLKDAGDMAYNAGKDVAKKKLNNYLDAKFFPDSATDISLKDLSKVTDKRLKKMVERVDNESKVKNYQKSQDKSGESKRTPMKIDLSKATDKELREFNKIANDRKRANEYMNPSNNKQGRTIKLKKARKIAYGK